MIGVAVPAEDEELVTEEEETFVADEELATEEDETFVADEELATDDDETLGADEDDTGVPEEEELLDVTTFALSQS